MASSSRLSPDLPRTASLPGIRGANPGKGGQDAVTCGNHGCEFHPSALRTVALLPLHVRNVLQEQVVLARVALLELLEVLRRYSRSKRGGTAAIGCNAAEPWPIFGLHHPRGRRGRRTLGRVVAMKRRRRSTPRDATAPRLTAYAKEDHGQPVYAVSFCPFPGPLSRFVGAAGGNRVGACCGRARQAWRRS